MWIDAEMLHITMYRSVFQNTTEAGDVALEYSCLVVNSMLEEERFRQLPIVNGSLATHRCTQALRSLQAMG